MNQNVSCFLCGAKGPASEILSTRFRDDDSGRFAVARCATCGHAQISPLPTEAEEAAYYAEDMQAKTFFYHDDYFAIEQSKAAPETERRAADLRAILPSEGHPRTLDIGSGYGFFVDHLFAAGYDACGLEISDLRIGLVGSKAMGGTFFHGYLDDAFVAAHENEFDAVTAFHVIEHLRNPEIYLRAMLRVAKPGGTIIVEVPNVADEMIAEIPEYADNHWQICHLSYFDAPRLELLLRRASFTDFQVRGVQRYGLDHLLNWTVNRAPDRGLWKRLKTTPTYDRAESRYRADREDRLTCDTVIAFARKTEDR